MVKIFSCLCSIVLVALLATGCILDKKIKVGISMPTEAHYRWSRDGKNMAHELENKGYEVDLHFAENKVDTQIAQIDNMINEGCKVIVISAIDNNSLNDVLNKATKNGCKIIAYDRLIINTDDVSYYVTFDSAETGKLQGSYIEDKLGLKDGKGPYNLEIAAGSLGDNNTAFLFDEALKVLKPYIDKGQLIVKSGQITREQCAIEGWSKNKAEERMANILSKYYTDEKIDAVLCASDNLALGVEEALKKAGYVANNMPIITGQDANLPNVLAITRGEQSMSIFKDTRELANAAINIIDALAENKQPIEINDTTTYNNGVKVVPTYKLKTVLVDAGNYGDILLNSGYYSDADFKINVINESY